MTATPAAAAAAVSFIAALAAVGPDDVDDDEALWEFFADCLLSVVVVGSP